MGGRGIDEKFREPERPRRVAREDPLQKEVPEATKRRKKGEGGCGGHK